MVATVVVVPVKFLIESELIFIYYTQIFDYSNFEPQSPDYCRLNFLKSPIIAKSVSPLPIVAVSVLRSASAFFDLAIIRVSRRKLILIKQGRFREENINGWNVVIDICDFIHFFIPNIVRNDEKMVFRINLFLRRDRVE